MENSKLVTSTAIIAVATLVIAATLSVGIALAQPFQPPRPFSKQVLQVRTVDSGQKTVPAGTTAATIASCLPGEVATGGGHQILLAGSNTENPNVTVGSDETPGHNPGWFITVTNPGPADIAIRATAVCTKLVDPP
jgi:hypothetical protein